MTSTLELDIFVPPSYKRVTKISARINFKYIKRLQPRISHLTCLRNFFLIASSTVPLLLNFNSFRPTSGSFNFNGCKARETGIDCGPSLYLSTLHYLITKKIPFFHFFSCLLSVMISVDDKSDDLLPKTMTGFSAADLNKSWSIIRLMFLLLLLLPVTPGNLWL